MKYHVYQCTHVGKRENNQDFASQAKNSEWACFMVADGLGGHARGEIAAQAVCEHLAKQAKAFHEAILNDPIKGMQTFLKTAVSEAQQQVLKKYGEMDTQTTLALAWINQKNLISAHIGDSRVYILNQDRIIWRTPDHTDVQVLFEKGEITENDMSNHPLQNHLLNAINMFEEPDPDIFVHPTLADDETLILCTDGFWGMCRQHDLMDLAQHKNALTKRLESMVDEIVDHSGGECDNVTIQVIKPNR